MSRGHTLTATNYEQHFRSYFMVQHFILTFKFHSVLLSPWKWNFIFVIDSGNLTSIYNWFLYLIFLREINSVFYCGQIKESISHPMRLLWSNNCNIAVLCCSNAVGPLWWLPLWNNMRKSELLSVSLLFTVYLDLHYSCCFCNNHSSNKTPLWLLSIAWLKEINSLTPQMCYLFVLYKLR